MSDAFYLLMFPQKLLILWSATGNCCCPPMHEKSFEVWIANEPQPYDFFHTKIPKILRTSGLLYT